MRHGNYICKSYVNYLNVSSHLNKFVFSISTDVAVSIHKKLIDEKDEAGTTNSPISSPVSKLLSKLAELGPVLAVKPPLARSST